MPIPLHVPLLTLKTSKEEWKVNPDMLNITIYCFPMIYRSSTLTFSINSLLATRNFTKKSSLGDAFYKVYCAFWHQILETQELPMRVQVTAYVTLLTNRCGYAHLQYTTEGPPKSKFLFVFYSGAMIIDWVDVTDLRSNATRWPSFPAPEGLYWVCLFTLKSCCLSSLPSVFQTAFSKNLHSTFCNQTSKMSIIKISIHVEMNMDKFVSSEERFLSCFWGFTFGSSGVPVVWNLKLIHKLGKNVDFVANQTSQGFRYIEAILWQMDGKLGCSKVF